MLTRTLLPFLPLFLLSVGVHATDWPQYRGPATDGKTPDKILKPWTSSSAEGTLESPQRRRLRLAVVAGGHAFTLSLKEVDGAKQEAIVALDANTGKGLWTSALNVAKYEKRRRR